MSMRVVYLGLDAHARHCVLGQMNSQGKYLGEAQFATSESELIRHVVRVEAKKKLLAVEEGPLARWIGQTLREYVDEVLICDPRENALINRNPNKKDRVDTHSLCRLLRLGELKRVYHPQDDERAVFKAAMQQYLDLRDTEVELKLKLKAKYRGWGVVAVEGTKVYGTSHRGEYLEQVKAEAIRHQLERLYVLLDAALLAQEQSLAEVVRLGRRYREIAEFDKVPGVGVVGAHLFDAYIQTPDRFETKRQLWRYCQLGVTDRSSEGKPLGFRRLDRAGNSELKAMSYHAWQTAVGGVNEVNEFYQQSLARTQDRVAARLNTQRKILATLWGLWKRKESYRKELFLGSA